MKFRSRADGSGAHPITPKTSFVHERPNFSPAQLLERYNQLKNPKDKLKLKRAALSIANIATVYTLKSPI